MTDRALRDLERRWRESGALADEVAYLGARLRAGDLTEERLRLAALVGSPAARAVLGGGRKPRFTPRKLEAFGQEALVRAGLGILERLRPHFTTPHPEEALLDRAMDALRSWCARPGVATRARAGELAGRLIQAAEERCSRRTTHFAILRVAGDVCIATNPACSLSTTFNLSREVISRAEIDLALRDSVGPWALERVVPVAAPETTPWTASAEPTRAGAWLERRVLDGTLELDRVRVAAILGDAASHQALGEAAPEAATLLELRWCLEHSLDHELHIRITIAVARAVLEQAEGSSRASPAHVAARLLVSVAGDGPVVPDGDRPRPAVRNAWRAFEDARRSSPGDAHDPVLAAAREALRWCSWVARPEPPHVERTDEELLRFYEGRLQEARTGQRTPRQRPPLLPPDVEESLPLSTSARVALENAPVMAIRALASEMSATDAEELILSAVRRDVIPWLLA